MDFNHTKSWKNLQQVLKAKLPINKAWDQVIDFHEQVAPKPYWKDLRYLDMQVEQRALTTWLETMTTTYPIPDHVVALWMGIFKAVKKERGKEKEVPTIYLIGADTYEKNSKDWACDPTYLPQGRYMHSGVLKYIDNIVKKDVENYAFFDWLFPLAYCALTLDDIIRTKLNKQSFLAGRKKLHFTTGHDSGDSMNISVIK